MHGCLADVLRWKFFFHRYNRTIIERSKGKKITNLNRYFYLCINYKAERGLMILTNYLRCMDKSKS